MTRIEERIKRLDDVFCRILIICGAICLVPAVVALVSRDIFARIPLAWLYADFAAIEYADVVRVAVSCIVASALEITVGIVSLRVMSYDGKSTLTLLSLVLTLYWLVTVVLGYAKTDSVSYVAVALGLLPSALYILVSMVTNRFNR